MKVRYPDVTLTILGDGPDRDAIQRQIVEYGLQEAVTLEGFVRDPSWQYQQSDVFALTSRWEGFGNALVEAMYFGLPVVMRDVPGGARELVKEGENGWLARSEDAISVAEQIIKSFETTWDRDAIRNSTKPFAVERIGDQYLEAFFR